MPRGGHMGLWKPTPKDIFKSRWKSFYKRCYRPRTSGNRVDRAPPHEQGNNPYDGVPSPWRLHYSIRNFGQNPTDARRSGYVAYKDNVQRYMKPSALCNSPVARDLVLRCLDRGRRGACDSGLGRAETAAWRVDAPPSHVPWHLYTIMEGEAKQSDASKDFLEFLKGRESQSDTFAVRRLYELCEEWELVWEGGLNDPRRPAARRSLPDGTKEEVNRGRFPYVDEQASLIDDLGLKEILRLGHRTSSRRHPKWREKVYWYKKFHSQYLRRKAIIEDEVKQRMGVLKASLDT